MGMIANATKKGLLPGELEIETFKNTDSDRVDHYAALRMKNIIASPDAVKRYGYDQNGARSANDQPGIPCADYNATVKGGD